jgi:hypothetical protein
MSFMFFNAELDRLSALSDVHFAAFTGDIVNAWCYAGSSRGLLLPQLHC